MASAAGYALMDTPLLALTRSRAARSDRPARERAAAENLRQLMQLRWMAVAGQAATIATVHYGLGVALPVVEMMAVVAALALVNLATSWLVPRHRVRTREIAAALLIDMAALTLQLHFSGGAENPFVSLYLLQVVLGAILLPLGGAAMLLVAAALAYALLATTHVPLVVPRGLLVEGGRLFAIGRWTAFVMVASLLVLFITRISRNLRARDAHLADLRQRAAEEENIVRMGLFASGAAHELGTPLATLSVILSDWRRMPKVAGDPALSSELEEMQAELRRCKSIVSDILHSAGDPRGEAMMLASAEEYLDSVADAWQAAHPQVSLDDQREDLGAAAIVAEPALRQAIWNLLDNAAEAAPSGVTLLSAIQGDSLVVAVLDRGPGFPAEVLEEVGRLYKSTKGAGHGLGLFLAASVARRLGGRLEARNRQEGGAEVRLVLPLARPNLEMDDG